MIGLVAGFMVSPGFSAAAAAVCQGFVCLFFGLGMANRAPVAGVLFLLAGICFAIMRSHITYRSLHARSVRVLSTCAAGLVGGGIVALVFTTAVSGGYTAALAAPALLQLLLAWYPERTENE